MSYVLLGVQLVLIVALIAFAITILAVTRNELADVDPVCYQYGYYYQCVVWVSGCLATGDTSDFKPCNYAYSVGAIALLTQTIQICTQWCDCAAIGNLVAGIFDLIWWTIPASYFTSEWEDAPDKLPQEHWRHVNMGIMWAAVAVSALQIVVSVLQCLGGRKGKGKEYEEKEEKHDAPKAAEVS